ncbi:hypothetical protein [Sorangium sp. So ce1024]|uniref:hypothetical protein n=1 Tax=Sorangium sp. So ce1024 TaxID=3133327 RepID=UPI003F03B693
MTEHKAWCPARDGGACADTRDDRTLDLFGDLERKAVDEACDVLEAAKPEAPASEQEERS